MSLLRGRSGAYCPLRKRRLIKLMSYLILKDAYVLAMRGPTDLPKLRSVIIQNNKIVKIVKTFNEKIYRNARIIDCQQQLLMPSFKNGHSHTAMHFLKDVVDTKDFKQWLSDVQKYEKELTPDDIYHLSLAGLIALIKSGYSYTFDMYFHSSSFAAACIELGFRSDVLVTTFNDDISLRRFHQELSFLKHLNHLVMPRVGIHALYSTEPAVLKKYALFSRLGFHPFFTHAAENAWENDESLQKYQMRPIPYLYKMHLFDFGGGIFHGIHLDEKDLEILKRKKVGVISCPQSNIQLHGTLPNYSPLLANKITVSLGTDGAASNRYMDPFHEMRLVKQKLTEEGYADPNLDYDILKMANHNVMATLKRRNLFSITFGQLADLILLDAARLGGLEQPDIFSKIIDRGQTNDVLMTIINGQVLYENRTLYLPQVDLTRNTARLAEIKSRILPSKK